MIEDSSDSVLSIVRTLAIFIAFAFAFYFFLLWNPVGTLGDVRHYLEHRVRVPVEWIVAVFSVAWIIQRSSGYAAAAVFFVPIFAVILALTKPDYGAEVWSIFRHEVYLNPIYVPRGLLVCVFILSLMVIARVRWNDRGIFLLCLVIGFALTSWEALITPAPPRGWVDRFAGGQSYTYEGWSDRSAGQLTELIWQRWLIVNHYIRQYIPPDYQNAVRIGVSVYPFLALFLLLFPGYRKLPKQFIREHQENFPIYLFLGVLVGLSGWAFFTAQEGAPGVGTKLVLGLLSIPALIALIVLFLSSIIWVPAVLFLFPAFLFWVLSQPFKAVYFLVGKVPFMVLHYVHYLMVPHPLEEVIKKYEEVQARDGAKIDYASFAKKMAQARYNRIREGIPAWWKSRNWEKRLKDVNALRGRVHVEKAVADKYREQFRTHHREEKQEATNGFKY